jgi:hypothetical protein
MDAEGVMENPLDSIRTGREYAEYRIRTLYKRTSRYAQQFFARSMAELEASHRATWKAS